MDKKNDKNTSFSKKRIVEFNGKKMDFTTPRVMGIVNVTPDSFYDGGWYKDDKTVRPKDWRNGGPGEEEKGRTGDLAIGRLGDLGIWKGRVEEMIMDGAYIIDIGAVSTRPGAAEVSGEEEKRRIKPVLREIRREFPEIIISIDTHRAEVARMAAGEGADMINDISGGTFDPEMHAEIARLQIPYVIMHIRGTPETMQQNPDYKDVVRDVKDFLLRQAMKLESLGHHKIIIDPGFGFGKTVEHNYKLLSHLDEFVSTGYPVLAGISRKSMINRVLGTKPSEALNGTTVLNTVALLKGASIIRVHDVKEAVEAVKLVTFATKC
jgi:dihydropteroate synthase